MDRIRVKGYPVCRGLRSAEYNRAGRARGLLNCSGRLADGLWNGETTGLVVGKDIVKDRAVS